VSDANKKSGPPAAKNRAPAPGPDTTPDDKTSERRFSGRFNVMVTSVLVIAIVVMCNILAFRNYRRWDWTTEGLFTLSPRTQELLHGLDQDIDVYLVLSSAESNYTDLRELLERYRAESQHIVLHFIDPDREPSEYQLIAERFGLASALLPDGSVGADVALVIVNGERQWKITRDDLVAVDFGAEDGGARVDVRSEQSISGGLVEVTSGRATRVCVATGHGEWTIDRGTERDLGGLRDEMRRENLEIETIETRGAHSIPENCDALFVIGPTQSYTEEEATLLRDWVRAGGDMLVTLDPELDRGEIRPTGLEDVLRELGVRVDRTVVLEMDEGHLMPSQPSPTGPFLVADYGEHPITSAFEGMHLPMVVNLVRSIRPADEGGATTLLSTSEAAFAETDVALLIQTMEPHRDDSDIPGPVSLAVAVEIEAPNAAADDDDDATDDGHSRGRLVVVGDSDFLSSGLISTREAINYEVASAMVGWLTERQALIAIPARRMTAAPVQLNEGDVLNLFFRVVVLLPLASIFLGIAVWWNRRT
jgi:ABC-type uncharacterized transport system involved in gliding motility auxiliary subunit